MRKKLKSYMAKPGEVKQGWYLINADGKTLGRLAAQIAKILRGKNKPQFTPHADVGDFVIVVNCEKIRVTGKKLDAKTYQRYSGYPGGLKEFNLRTLLAKKPAEVLRLAVKGMLPETNQGRHLLDKLKLYVGPDHPHQAQQPEVLEV